MRNALAIYTLIAYHGTKAILRTTTAAINALTPITPVEPNRLLTEGRQLLSTWTIARSEGELQAHSKRKFATLRERGVRIPENFRFDLVKAETSAVDLVATAYRRAQIVLSAYEKVQKAIKKKQRQMEKRRLPQEDDVTLLDPVLHAEIQAAFDRYRPDLHVGCLWEIAIYADINPAVLWPQHIKKFAHLFELARFIGRVDRGVEARLALRHLDLLFAIVDGSDIRQGDDSDDTDYIAAATQEKFLLHFRREDLLVALEEAMKQGGALIVGRDTRALGVEEPGPAIPEENDLWLEALTAMIHQFMPRGRSKA